MKGVRRRLREIARRRLAGATVSPSQQKYFPSDLLTFLFSLSLEMRATDKFRRQHEELVVLAGKIQALLDPVALTKDATEVRRMVAKFRGVLVVHARMENEALYPRLLEHPEPAVRTKVEAIFRDVGPIYDQVDVYAQRWPSADAIRADVSGFIRDTVVLLRTLGVRLTREDRELYPLADSLG